MADSFKMHVRVELEKVNENGGFFGDRFSMNEEFTFTGIESFAQIARILSQFHLLAEELKEQI